MSALALLLWLVACVLMLPSVSDLLSVARILSRRARRSSLGDTRPPRLLFLVPAHDEELLIESCLRALAQLRYPADCVEVVVVADNCSDGTATIARAAGVRCLERRDPDRLGKPHAIVWALQQLSLSGTDAVVIIDADTLADRECAAALAASAPLRDKVIQCYNDVWNRTDTALTRMAAVLSAAMHQFAFGLKTRAGLNVPLSDGMCLGTGVLAVHGWPAFSIGEDWEMYAFLTAQGVRIESVPAARISAQQTRALRQSASQRRRWMAGKLVVLLRYARTLLSSPNVRLAQRLDSIAELSAPGPAVHLGLVLTALAVDWSLRPPGAPWIALVLGASLIRWAVYTLAALRVDPEPGRAVLAFAFLPFYVLWRLWVALTTLATLGDAAWVRTHRHPTSETRAGG